MLCIEGVLVDPMCAGNGGDPTAQRRQRIPQTGRREISADSLRCRRHGLEGVRDAPGLEVLQIGLVRPQCAGGVRGGLMAIDFAMAKAARGAKGFCPAGRRAI